MPLSRQLLLTLLLTVAGSRLPAGAPLELASLPVGAEVTGDRRGHTFVARRLSERPHAFLLKNWLTQDECNALMKTAESHGLETAETSGETEARRHCDVAVLSPWKHDTVKSIQVDAARTLLSEEAMSLPGGGCEDLHVLRYQPGGEYKPHFDAANNPRVLTCLYYLNGVGATWFPLAGKPLPEADGYQGLRAHIATLDPATDGLRFEPTGPGDTLVFYNFDADGHNDPWSLHAGLEVDESEGTKWIASHFFNVPALTRAHKGTDSTAA